MKLNLLKMCLIAPLLFHGFACGGDDDDNEPAGMDDGGMDDGGMDDGGMDAGGMDEAGTLLEELTEDGRFETLLSGIDTAGLDVVLDGDGPFTLFAPTDDAFDALPVGTLDALTPADLEAFLGFHVSSGAALDSAAVASSAMITTLSNGQFFIVQDLGGSIVLNGTTQLSATDVDIEATNGVIHVIDSVLLPGDFPGTLAELLAAYPMFSILSGAIVSEGLDTTLSAPTQLTLFAPSNSAFEGIDLAALPVGRLNDILNYHAVTGAMTAAMFSAAASLATLQGTAISVMVQNAGADIVLDGTTFVTFTDVQATNGIMHIVESVLMPPL